MLCTTPNTNSWRQVRAVGNQVCRTWCSMTWTRSSGHVSAQCRVISSGHMWTFNMSIYLLLWKKKLLLSSCCCSSVEPVLKYFYLLYKDWCFCIMSTSINMNNSSRKTKTQTYRLWFLCYTHAQMSNVDLLRESLPTTTYSCTRLWYIVDDYEKYKILAQNLLLRQRDWENSQSNTCIICFSIGSENIMVLLQTEDIEKKRSSERRLDSNDHI